MKITDLAPVEKWRELEDEIHEKFHINAAITDAEGGLVTGFNHWGSELCKAIKDDPKGAGAICAVAAQTFNARAHEEKEPFCEVCDALMTKICVPVVVDGEVLGIVGGCGVLTDDEEVEEYMVEMSTDMDADTVSGLAAKVRELSDSEVQDVIAFISGRVDDMVKSG